MPRLIGPQPTRAGTVPNDARTTSHRSDSTPATLDHERDRLLPTLRGRRARTETRLPANHRVGGLSLRRLSRRPTVSKEALEEGKTLSRGDRGPAISHTQALLLKHGFRVGRSGYFGKRTELKVMAFQKANGLEETGKVNPETFAALQKPAGGLLANLRDTSLAQAATAILSTSRSAFDTVVGALDRTFGEFIYGDAPYMVSRQLSQHPDFREVEVPPTDLKDLPPGAVVVWNRSLESPDGDISIALGDGREVGSDIKELRSLAEAAIGYRTFIVT